MAPRPRQVCCDLAGHAIVRVPLEGIGTLRRQPGPPCGAPLPASFLKHADEQTIVGLSAVYHAIHDYHLAGSDGPQVFRAWGALAAPRFLGRPTMVTALQRFSGEGAWGVSPHLIPHRSLHAISGTVSQALKIHGPNFGVGGGPTAGGEVLVAAAGMLECQHLPGMWVVLTGYDPDSPPDEVGHMPSDTHCVGLALALTPPRPHWAGIRLRISLTGERPTLPTSERGAPFNLIHLATLLRSFSGSRPGSTTMLQTLDDAPGCCCRLELSRGPREAGEPSGVRQLWRDHLPRGLGTNGIARQAG
jgi:hypothetical protein